MPLPGGPPCTAASNRSPDKRQQQLGSPSACLCVSAGGACAGTGREQPPVQCLQAAGGFRGPPPQHPRWEWGSAALPPLTPCGWPL